MIMPRGCGPDAGRGKDTLTRGLLTSRSPGTRSRVQRTQRPERNSRCENVGMLESGFRVNVATFADLA